MLKLLKRIIIILVVLALAGFGYYWFVLSPKEAGKCLDSGGSWDKEAKVCLYQENLEVTRN